MIITKRIYSIARLKKNFSKTELFVRRTFRGNFPSVWNKQQNELNNDNN